MPWLGNRVGLGTLDKVQRLFGVPFSRKLRALRAPEPPSTAATPYITNLPATVSDCMHVPNSKTTYGGREYGRNAA